jgi:hypothetical protein
MTNSFVPSCQVQRSSQPGNVRPPDFLAEYQEPEDPFGVGTKEQVRRLLVELTIAVDKVIHAPW